MKKIMNKKVKERERKKCIFTGRFTKVEYPYLRVFVVLVVHRLEFELDLRYIVTVAKNSVS